MNIHNVLYKYSDSYWGLLKLCLKGQSCRLLEKKALPSSLLLIATEQQPGWCYSLWGLPQVVQCCLTWVKPLALTAQYLQDQGAACEETGQEDSAGRAFITFFSPQKTMSKEEMQFQNGKSQWISRGILGRGERRQAPNNRMLGEVGGHIRGSKVTSGPVTSSPACVEPGSSQRPLSWWPMLRSAVPAPHHIGLVCQTRLLFCSLC